MPELVAGPELDRAVAEAIGISSEDFDTCRNLHWPNVMFQYSTDLNAAFAAAEKIGLFGGEYDDIVPCKLSSGRWLVQKREEHLESGAYMFDALGAGPTLSIAICAAILKLKETQNALDKRLATR